MKYKITIEEITQYNVKESVYEAEDGKRYFSTYKIPDGMKFTEKYKETGAVQDRTKTIFTQEVELEDITPIIVAANNL